MSELDTKDLFPFSEKIHERKQLKNKFKTLWTEDVFFGAPAYSSDTSSHFVGNHFTEKRSWFFIACIIVVMCTIFVRLLQVQVVNGQSYFEQAEGNRQRIRPIHAERGLIFDAKGRQLVKNIPNFHLALVPQDLPKTDEGLNNVVHTLAELTKQNPEEIASIIEQYKDYRFESVVIKEDLDYDTALAIYIESSDLPGVFIEQGSKREYFNSVEAVQSATTTALAQIEPTQSLSHVLGYLGKLNPDELESLYNVGYLPSDSLGKSGIEKQYEEALRGRYGRRRVEVNSAGVMQKTLAEEQAIPGNHLYLTLDLSVQEELEHIMKKHFQKNGKARGSAIAMDPRDGSIVALVSLPSFNNNDFSGGIDAKTYSSYISNTDHPLFNRAISGEYPSGSTIKPLIAAGALQEGTVSENTSVLSTGGISVGPWFFPDWQAGGHGVTNVRRSIAWSVNTFYYYVGGGYNDFKGMGLETLITYFKKFMLGQQLGLDMPGEGRGFIPTREWKKNTLNESWYIGDTYNVSIGQGNLLVTPLQIAAVTSAVANEGTIYKPHLMKQIKDVDGNEVKTYDKEIIAKDMVSRDNMRIVSLGMRDCVTYGSCRYLNSLPIEVAGKTGTAQWNQNKDDHAWFTSFAPYSNPEIVLTIMVEEGVAGSGIGAQIAYDFYAWWAQYKKS